MEHINYYQLFQAELDKKSEEKDLHANNSIIKGIITLIGMEDFNEWYASNVEEIQQYKKLDVTELHQKSQVRLHESLRLKSHFTNHYNSGTFTQHGTHNTIGSGECLEEILYHSMTQPSIFWKIHFMVYSYYNT